MPYKQIVNELAVLVGLSLVMAFTVNFVSPNGIALFGRWDTSKGVISPMSKNDALADGIEISDAGVIKSLFDQHNALFVDARATHLYDERHIKGAVSLPVHQFDDYIDDFFSHYTPDRLIITYCSGRECTDSHRLAQYLEDAGYEHVRIYIDGISGWEAEGYPVE